MAKSLAVTYVDRRFDPPPRFTFQRNEDYSFVCDDPRRPADADYYDLNNVPWYACMQFEDRIRYLDWIIAKREAEDRIWRAEYAAAHDEDGPNGFKLSQFVCSKFSMALQELRTHRRVELEDRDPLKTMRVWCGAKFELIQLPWRPQAALYRSHINSCRWKRTRTRKMMSVSWRCEYPGCAQPADECHHLHYETLGLEENADLEALCSPHHRARHGL